METSISMTWPKLNIELLATENEQLLHRWLRDELDAGQPQYRVMRIYCRLAAVRRRRELAELRQRKWPTLI
jgi:hypothetical protein